VSRYATAAIIEVAASTNFQADFCAPSAAVPSVRRGGLTVNRAPRTALVSQIAYTLTEYRVQRKTDILTNVDVSTTFVHRFNHESINQSISIFSSDRTSRNYC